MKSNTLDALDDWLEQHGLFIQTERPLHEPPMSYLEEKDDSQYKGGKEIVQWWKSINGEEPFAEGAGHYYRARRIVQRMYTAWEGYTKEVSSNIVKSTR